MLFPSPITQARLINRYKRFLSDMQLNDGSIITAHCPNPGSMLGLCEPNSTAWLLPQNNPKAKYAWQWEVASDNNNNLVGINTLRANHLAYEGLCQKTINEVSEFQHIRKEVKVGDNSRLDFVINDDNGNECFVEVKSVTLKRKDYAEFPDSKTIRGLKHLQLLRDLNRQGHKTMLLFIVQRQDCNYMRAADDIHPEYASTLAMAKSEGVMVGAYRCIIEPTQIKLDSSIEVQI